MPRLVYSPTGSNTAASGAGPTAAITGAAACHNGNAAGGTVFYFTNTPDLSGVLNGHVLYAETASGQRHLYEIASADNAAKSVTVYNTDAPAIALGSAVNYAIGGKRLHGAGDAEYTDMKQASDAVSSNDPGGGWTLALEAGDYNFVDFFNDDLSANHLGNANHSYPPTPMLVANDPTGARPRLLVDGMSLIQVNGFAFHHLRLELSASAPGNVNLWLTNSMDGCEVVNKSATYYFNHQLQITRVDVYWQNCVFDSVELTGTGHRGRWISRTRFTNCNHTWGGAVLFQSPASNNLDIIRPTILADLIFENCGGDAIGIQRFVLSNNVYPCSMIIRNITINNCNGSGIVFGGVAAGTQGGQACYLSITNVSITNCGAYGIDASAMPADWAKYYEGEIDYILANGNTSGNLNNMPTPSNLITAAPQYTDAAAGNYQPAAGSPLIGAGYSIPARLAA